MSANAIYLIVYIGCVPWLITAVNSHNDGRLLPGRARGVLVQGSAEIRRGLTTPKLGDAL
jgi:hypothetical protein